MTFSIVDFKKGFQIDSELLKIESNGLYNELLSLRQYGEKIQFLNRDHPFKCPKCEHTGNFNPHEYIKNGDFEVKKDLYYIKGTHYVYRVYSLTFRLKCLKCSVKDFIETEVRLNELLRILREEKEFVKGKERLYEAYIV